MRLCRSGEMVDTPALGAGGVTPVEVQVLSSAPWIQQAHIQ